MKKIILCLIATVSISNLSFGQITLESSWNKTDKINTWGQAYTFITDAGLNYFTFFHPNSLEIYNSSHSRTNNIKVPIDTGYILTGIYGLSDKLFNNDSLIEFLVFTEKTNLPAGSYAKYKLTLVNQNGDVLQQLGEVDYAQITKDNNGKFKLITTMQYEVSREMYNVWSLPGTSLGILPLNKNISSLVGYPNPTENRITITNNLENGQNATLQVFEINGKKVMQKNVAGENGEINLDVTELNEGVYIYKLNGQTNRFVKK